VFCLQDGYHRFLEAGLPFTALYAKGNGKKIFCQSVVNREDTNFSRIGDAAPIEHSFQEAEDWLCTQT